MRRWLRLSVACGLAGAAVVVPAWPAAAGTGVWVSVVGGQLAIFGTPLDDQVTVRPVRSGTTVTGYRVTDDRAVSASTGCSDDGPAVLCPAAGVTSSYVWLDAGDDRFEDFTDLTRTVYGADGEDRLYAANAGGLSYLDGGPGGDHLAGGLGSATELGGPGGDIIEGGFGPDFLSGGDGGDLLLGWSGADILSGGDGTDTVSYIGETGPVTASLDGAVGNDGLVGEGDTIEADVESLEGGQGNDYLVGNDGPNQLAGLPGTDVLVGNGGDDVLEGYDDGDWLDGGPGRDVLRGGNGDDYLLGGADNDWLQGDSGRDGLHGGVGADWCFPGDGEATTACERVG